MTIEKNLCITTIDEIAEQNPHRKGKGKGKGETNRNAAVFIDRLGVEEKFFGLIKVAEKVIHKGDEDDGVRKLFVVGAVDLQTNLETLVGVSFSLVHPVFLPPSDQETSWKGKGGGRDDDDLF